MNAQEIFNSSELAFASYASLLSGATAAQRGALEADNIGMSSTQSGGFSSRFPTIISQFNDTAAEGGMGTSFSATVFKDASMPGKLTLAIRGTLELAGAPNDLIPTDASTERYRSRFFCAADLARSILSSQYEVVFVSWVSERDSSASLLLLLGSAAFKNVNKNKYLCINPGRWDAAAQYTCSHLVIK